MRKQDEHKPITGKASKTISFDKIILKKLEERSKQTGATVSQIVNRICRRVVLSDPEYYRELSKYHYLKFQEFQFMKDQCLNNMEVQQ